MLEKETDVASVERLARLDEELANLQESSDGMKAHWRARGRTPSPPSAP